jgi:ABC-2 type transport system permease protein
MKTLIRREFWEHRGAFIKAPIIISIVLFVITIGAYITGLVLANKSGSRELADTGIRELANLPTEKLAMFWDIQLVTISSLYLTVLFFVLFFFLLGSLFDDRKDGSILFWKSLPISDTETVLSKLITAMIFVPLAFVAIFLIATIVEMIIYSVLLLFHGLNPIQLVWAPVSLFTGIYIMLLGAFVQMLWAMPLYAWLIFSSSISKRRPFLFAIFIPAIISFSWYWINILSFKFTDISMFKKPLFHLAHAVLPYGSGSMSNNSFNFNPEKNSSLPVLIGNMQSSILSLEIFYGIIVAVVFIAISIWVRRYRNTT